MSIGLGKSKYLGPEAGPFKCEHCRYFTSPTFCRQEDVLADARQGLLVLQDGKAIIHPRGCCGEYEPVSAKR